MPFIRSLAFKYCTYIVAVILLFSEIMPSCSCCEEKKLVYIIIIAPFSRQPSSCSKCIKLNIYLSCDVQSMLDIECAFLFILSLSHLNGGITRRCAALLAYHCILWSLRLPCLIYCRVLCPICSWET